MLQNEKTPMEKAKEFLMVNDEESETTPMEKAKEFLMVNDEESETISRVTTSSDPVGIDDILLEDIVLKGIRVDRVEPGLIVCSFKVPPRLADRAGNFATGAISYLVDQVGAKLIHPQMNVSVDMSISLLSTAKSDDELEITARLLGQRGGYSGTLVLIRNKATGEVVSEGRHSLFGKPSLFGKHASKL